MEKFINKKKKQLVLWSTLAVMLFLAMIIIGFLELENILISMSSFTRASSLLTGVFAAALANIFTIKSALKIQIK